MGDQRGCVLLFFLAVAVDQSTAWSVTPSDLLGVAPQDGEYFSSEVIYCRDGSKSFGKDLLNDDFCDCPDGTDEPGTSACPEGKFYCRNNKDEPQILFSSRVNDRICDCCDGSDEYDSGVICQNTCKKSHGSNSNPDPDEEEQLFTSIKDLRIVAIVEFVLASVMIVYGLSRWRARLKRKRYSLRNLASKKTFERESQHTKIEDPDKTEDQSHFI